MKYRPVIIDDNGNYRIEVGDRWRLAEERECYYCGDIFLEPKHFKKYHEQYCSKSCAAKAKSKSYRRQQVVKRCKVCWTPFKAQPSKADRHSTCGNPACQREYKRRITTERHRIEGRLFGRVK